MYINFGLKSYSLNNVLVISDHGNSCASKQCSLTCGFSRFRTTNNGQFYGHGRVGFGLVEVFDRVDHEGIACLLRGKEVDVVVEENREASV